MLFITYGCMVLAVMLLMIIIGVSMRVLLR